MITDSTELLYAGLHEGARALFAVDLTTLQSRVVLSAGLADARAVWGIGPARRPAYASLGVGQFVFDPRARDAIERARTAFPGHEIGVIDENADGSRYVFFVKGANEAGAYYYYDSNEAVASLIAAPFSALSGVKIASARTVRIDASDGSAIEAVLFEPYAPGSHRSAVVLTARDQGSTYPDLDALAEFLAAHGHVVLRLHKGYRPRLLERAGARNSALPDRPPCDGGDMAR